VHRLAGQTEIDEQNDRSAMCRCYERKRNSKRRWTRNKSQRRINIYCSNENIRTCFNARGKDSRKEKLERSAWTRYMRIFMMYAKPRAGGRSCGKIAREKSAISPTVIWHLLLRIIV